MSSAKPAGVSGTTSLSEPYRDSLDFDARNRLICPLCSGNHLPHRATSRCNRKAKRRGSQLRIASISQTLSS